MYTVTSPDTPTSGNFLVPSLFLRDTEKNFFSKLYPASFYVTLKKIVRPVPGKHLEFASQFTDGHPAGPGFCVNLTTYGRFYRALFLKAHLHREGPNIYLTFPPFPFSFTPLLPPTNFQPALFP